MGMYSLTELWYLEMCTEWFQNNHFLNVFAGQMVDCGLCNVQCLKVCINLISAGYIELQTMLRILNIGEYYSISSNLATGIFHNHDENFVGILPK